MAEVDNRIIVKLIKIIGSRFDSVSEKADYAKSFSFLPVYFDNDYLLERNFDSKNKDISGFLSLNASMIKLTDVN